MSTVGGQRPISRGRRPVGAGGTHHIAAWAIGAEGERRLGWHLDRLVSLGIAVLHDRAVPGSRANIDHIAVTPTGVWIIDTKLSATKQIERRRIRRGFTKQTCLFVGGRNQTTLVDGIEGQVDVVRTALGATAAFVPIRPALCFLDADWPTAERQLELRDVLVCAERTLTARLRSPGELSPVQIDAIARQLSIALPPAE